MFYASLSAALSALVAVLVYLLLQKKKYTPVSRPTSAEGACLLSIGTSKPKDKEGKAHIIDEESMSKLYKNHYDHVGEDATGFVEKVIKGSKIEERHTCVKEIANSDLVDGVFSEAKFKPDTEARSKLWDEYAPAMALEAARLALERADGVSASDITHVVSHSCTGWKAPGLAFDVIEGLKLSKATKRIEVNFMGCFGAFTGMSVAKYIVESDPKAKVIVVCAELCTLHVSSSSQKELLIGNTLFSDGAAACVIGQGGDWVIGHMGSRIVPDSAEMMTWFPSMQEYKMWLSRGIPKALGMYFYKNGKSLLEQCGIASFTDCDWAVHPGGASILYAFGEGMKQYGIKDPEHALKASYDVLRKNGNMSSATILYVLEEKLKAVENDSIFMAGFGPGLTLEFGALHKATHAKPIKAD